jgi:hypothetical protein
MQLLTLLLAATFIIPAAAQLATRKDYPATQAAAPHRTHLILRDGSYQIVMSYKVVGKNVQYVSAERGGATELIPLDLVDVDATQKWDAQHQPLEPGAYRPAPAIDPELLREEKERELLAPEVAPDLRLDPQDTVLGLDTFRAGNELVPLAQTDGELNRQTGHSILRSIVKPQAAPHQIVILKGEKSAVQMHVNDPAFFFKLDDALPDSGASAMTVDTHGAAAQNTPRKPQQANPDYVILRVDVRQDARVLASFNMQQLGTGKRQEDVFETSVSILPGGHWLKVAPKEQLLIGEYALVEILDEKSINVGVWDFGIHPTAPENRDALKPEKKRAVTLERRSRL